MNKRIKNLSRKKGSFVNLDVDKRETRYIFTLKVAFSVNENVQKV